MPRATFRFYAELTFFLPAARRGAAFLHAFDAGASLKDTVEALGVPHPEVELVQVNGAAQGWGYALRDGDEVHVFPSSQVPADAPGRVGPPPLAEPRFVLDTHLGRLAAHLRMVGFDTLYRNDYADDELARVSRSEDRILLTRDLGLLKRSLVVRGYFVRETHPEQQLVEVMRRYDLAARVAPFRRCTRCNGLLHPVSKEEVADRLPPETRAAYDEFRQCEACGQLYWKGSHFQRLEQFLAGVLRAAGTGDE